MGKLAAGVLGLVLLSACGSATGRSTNLSQNANHDKVDESGCNPSGTPLGGGSGKEGNPYLVCSVEHLKAMANSFTQDYFALTSDLDLSQEHDSLGTAVTGVFDGRGHTLKKFCGHSRNGEGKWGALRSTLLTHVLCPGNQKPSP